MFFNVVDSKFDLWTFLGSIKNGVAKHKEIRADTYFHLHDKRYGLKLRSGSTLELKVLQECGDKHSAEKWKKTIHTQLPLHASGFQDIKWKDELAPHLGSSKDAKEVMKLLSKFHSSKLITISKERTQEFLDFNSLNLPPPANKGGCIAGNSISSLNSPTLYLPALEQVDLSFNDKHGKNMFYRSICFEGRTTNLQLNVLF